MHICCAPDATVPVLRLRAKGYEPVGFFCDPNIHPKAEYELRLEQARKLAFIENFELIVGPYEPERWLAATREFWDEPEGGLRCPRCFGVLLDAAAHKDVHVLEQVGREKGALYGITFLPEAFRKQDGFRESVHLSKEYGLYRQNYCGCIYSRIESEKWRTAHPHGSSWSREEPKDGSGRGMSRE
jgi:predicted adenine nucleotide alpha hydrolase (AANH) superfamily ATPase